jgi:hypothetical protein
MILQEAVHLSESFNPITLAQIMDKDVEVNLVNYYCLNLY